jgi:hypothetical protein
LFIAPPYSSLFVSAGKLCAMKHGVFDDESSAHPPDSRKIHVYDRFVAQVPSIYVTVNNETRAMMMSAATITMMDILHVAAVVLLIAFTTPTRAKQDEKFRR